MMSEALRHYLIVFDHSAGQLVHEPQEFDDAKAALDAYAATEREYRRDDRMEVVLIGSDSLDTVKLTHANYFDGTVAISKYLADV